MKRIICAVLIVLLGLSVNGYAFLKTNTNTETDKE